MTKRDIAGELMNYAMLVEACSSETALKALLAEMAKTIPGWKKDLQMEERK